MDKPARNEPCSCGSGKKYKKCHYLIDHEKERHDADLRKVRTKREAEQSADEREARLRTYQERAQRRDRRILATLLGLAAVAGGSIDNK